MAELCIWKIIYLTNYFLLCPIDLTFCFFMFFVLYDLQIQNTNLGIRNKTSHLFVGLIFRNLICFREWTYIMIIYIMIFWRKSERAIFLFLSTFFAILLFKSQEVVRSIHDRILCYRPDLSQAGVGIPGEFISSNFIQHPLYIISCVFIFRIPSLVSSSLSMITHVKLSRSFRFRHFKWSSKDDFIIIMLQSLKFSWRRNYPYFMLLHL